MVPPHQHPWLSCLRLDILTENNQIALVIIRDVPDIRFWLAGYPAIFSNLVPAPVPAKMVPGTGYLSRIVLSPFCAFRASL